MSSSNFHSEDSSKNSEEITDFDLTGLSSIIKKFSNIIQTATTKDTNPFTHFSEISPKDRTYIQRMMAELSLEDRDEIISMVKNNENQEKIRTWWRERGEDERTIDIIISFSDMFTTILGDNNSQNNQNDNIMGRLMDFLGKEVSNDINDIHKEDKDNDHEEEDDETTDDAVVLSNLGNYISTTIRHFNGKEEKDYNKVKEKVVDAFSDSGVDKEYMSKCFDAGLDMGKKVIELEEEYVHNTSNNSSDNNNQDNNNQDNNNQDNNNQDNNNQNENEDEKNEDKGEDTFADLINGIEKYTKGIKVCMSKMKNVDPNNMDQQDKAVKEGFGSILKELGVDGEEIAKFEKSFDFGIKLQDKIKEVTQDINLDINQDTTTGDNKYTTTDDETVRHGLIEEAVKMIHHRNKIASDCDKIISLLTPNELHILSLRTDIPTDNKIYERLSVLENKIDTILNNTEVGDKLDDISLDLELIRNKL